MASANALAALTHATPVDARPSVAENGTGPARDRLPVRLEQMSERRSQRTR